MAVEKKKGGGGRGEFKGNGVAAGEEGKVRMWAVGAVAQCDWT